jgi:hypothetical protein
MDKKIENILNLYENILSNKNLTGEPIKEVVDFYNNVDFKDNVVGSSKPSKDNINSSLLSDIDAAAKRAGVNVVITTAVSGHSTKTSTGNVSRHSTGNAVDISIIDGKPVRTIDKGIIDKFVNELVKMGYVRGVESGNPKAILDYTFKGGGHEGHIHISKIDKDSSDISIGDDKATGSNVSFSDDEMSDPILYSMGQNIAKIFNPNKMNESITFGKNIKTNYGKLIIPKNSNSKIKSPISGIVDNTKYSSGCPNQIMIKTNDTKPQYLQYCGISSPKVRNGDSIFEGQLIGETNNDVEITLYNSSFKIIPLNKNTKINGKKDDKEYKDEFKKDKTTNRYEDPVLAALVQLPFKPFENQYDETGKIKEKRIGLATDKRPVDPWILNMIKKPFQKKVNENVERIKKLL